VEARISVITLGVNDVQRSLVFYRDGLGWPVSSAGDVNFAILRTGGTALALYPRALLAEDANVPADGNGFGGITLGHNVGSKEAVDAALAAAMAAGGTILKPAMDTFWGGYSGYFSDLDGYPWEVAWAPDFPLAADGSLQLPE
jgi:uncharacterized protein